MTPRAVSLILRLLAALAAFLAAAAPLCAQRPVRFERIPAHTLEIPIPGVALVRDSARWATLWHRFGEVAYTDTGRVRHRPPPVDFRRYAVVVMAGPATSGCTNAESFVRGVSEWPDSVVVRLGPRAYPPGESTCDMLVHPIDVVRIPRPAGPVMFRGPRGWMPGLARWWDRPTPAQLERMPEDERQVFTGVLVRDPATPKATVAAIARRLARTDWSLAGQLLERPDVVRDPRIVTDLALVEGIGGSEARALLFDRYGLALARDPRTPRRTLRALLEEFTRRDPPPPEISLALARHPTVLGDRALLAHLAREVAPHGEIHRRVCRAYLARYPAWEEVRDSAGRPTGARSSSLSCPNLPPSAPRGGGDRR